jgi:site-specific recombinase XerD
MVKSHASCLPAKHVDDLRKTTATTLLEKGVAPSTFQRFFGHANVATTCPYDRRSEDAKKAAAGLLRV